MAAPNRPRRQRISSLGTLAARSCRRAQYRARWRHDQPSVDATRGGLFLHASQTKDLSSSVSSGIWSFNTPENIYRIRRGRADEDETTGRRISLYVWGFASKVAANGARASLCRQRASSPPWNFPIGHGISSESDWNHQHTALTLHPTSWSVQWLAWNSGEISAANPCIDRRASSISCCHSRLGSMSSWATNPGVDPKVASSAEFVGEF